MKKYLLTGAAGFIASVVTKMLLEQGAEVVGLDNLNHHFINLMSATETCFIILSLPGRDLTRSLTWQPGLVSGTAWKTPGFIWIPMGRVL
jgi:nucleoside-diphosphate-sugar epimerase